MSDDPDILVDLTTARTEFEAREIAGALEEHGVPAQVFAMAANMLAWEIAAGQPIRVQVRRRDLEMARAILQEMPKEARKIDWSQVDTGDPTSPEGDVEVCSNCGYGISGIPHAARCPECGAALEPRTTERLELPKGTEVAWRKPVVRRPKREHPLLPIIGCVLIVAVVAVALLKLL